MKIILLLLPLLVTGFLVFKPVHTPVSNSINAIPLCGYSTDGRVSPMANGKFVGVLPGWGNYSYKISTKVDSAQVYFNQGLTMYYSYHMKEATASFKEAARLDSTCAMA